MGIFNILRNQAIDVIEWTDNTRDTMVYKYDRGGKDIMMGAQLTVRESQCAIFVNEGQLADFFLPGRYELKTANMPLMTKLQAWQYGFNSPFKADVYFINTKQFLGLKWGTANPVMMRDSEFGVIRIRAFGSYAFRVSDAVAFLQEVFGTSHLFTTAGLEGHIKQMLVSAFSDAVAESKIPALDLAANYDELTQAVLARVNPKLVALGIQLTSFVIENISLPEEVEKAMDRRTSMGVVGNVEHYARYQAAEALREAANNPSGAAGAGVGMGAGMAMGQMFAQTMTPTAPTSQTSTGSFCTNCGQPVAAGAKFCPSCGARQASAAAVCPGCGQPITSGARFCANCGQKIS